jgi:hypothetical protein
MVNMQIARDSGRIAVAYTVETICPYCKMSKLRYDLEFQAVSIENGKAIDSSHIIKNLCVHCLTVCDELPNMDFLCAHCGQITTFLHEDFGAELDLFKRVFAPGFSDFYSRLANDGIQAGKRFCMNCLFKIWNDFQKNPNTLQDELKKSKPDYPPKKY